MIKRRRFPKVFFGWWTVIGGGILGSWVVGYASFGFSALFKPIASELGFSRAIASTASGVARLEGGFEGLAVGWATDKFGPRAVVLFGVFVCGLGLVLMNYINSLWAFIVVWAVIIGTGHNIASGVPIDTAISNWFVKKRGVAIGIRYVFAACWGIVIILMAWLIVNLGWRMTCVIGGLITWLVGSLLAWFCFKRHRPEYYGLLPDGAAGEEAADTSQMIERGVKYAAEAEEVEFTLRQAMRTRAYWLLFSAAAVHGLVSGGINVHLVPYLTDIGVEPVKAAGMMSIIAVAGIPARLASGFITDRVSRNQIRFVIAGGYGIQVIGYVLFLLNPESLSAIYVWLVLYGFGVGTGFMLNVMVGRYYGRKAYGSIRGSQMMFTAAPSFFAPIYLGWVYDTTGSYITAFMQFTVALAVATVIMALAAPPRPPARITDIHKLM